MKFFLVVWLAILIATIEANSQIFPYQTSIRHNKYNIHLCNGVILSENWILTAASCVNDVSETTLEVQYGEPSSNSIIRNSINHKVIHHDYEPGSFKNNIAFLLTTKKISFFPGFVEPIVAQTDPVASGEPVTVLGWIWKEVDFIGIYIFKFQNKIFNSK